MQQYRYWLGVESSILLQKIRIKWIQKEDLNTTYFHSVLEEKRARTRIEALVNEEGEVVTDQEQVTQMILNFYKSLLGARAHGLQEVGDRVLRSGHILPHMNRLDSLCQ